MPVSVLVRGRAVGTIAAFERKQVASCLRSALAALQRRAATVSLVFTDDDEIRQLNRDYRKMNRATDVLSFQTEELDGETDPRGVGAFLGDIIVSLETTQRRKPRSTPMVRELERLVIHGLCHLFGHDHKRVAEGQLMRRLERKLLRVSRQASIRR